jgi:hypothetical protein
MAQRRLPVGRLADVLGEQVRGMAKLKKITVEVPERDLVMAQELTGAGVTETVRAALRKLAGIKAQHDLLKLKGTFQFTVDLDELREDRKW